MVVEAEETKKEAEERRWRGFVFRAKLRDFMASKHLRTISWLKLIVQAVFRYLDYLIRLLSAR